MYVIVPRQGSSTSEAPQETSTRVPESSPSAETRTTPTRTTAASQTRPTASSTEQPTSSRPQSTTDDITTTSARETTTSPPDSTSAPLTSTSDQPTSTPDSQTSSQQSQTSETVASPTQTPSDSVTTPTQSATDSATSQDVSSSSVPTSTASSVSDTPTPTPTPSPTPSPSPSTSQSLLPTPTETTGSSNAPSSTTTPGSTRNPVTATTTQPPSPSSEAGATSSLTSVVVTVVSSINGVPTTFTTVVPTLATSPNGSSGLSARTTNIVGGVVGGTLALLGVLVGLFYISRRRRKVAAALNNPRLQAPRQILDADDFDLAEPPGPAPYAYGVVGARANSNASGSIFHEDLPGTTTHHSHTHSQSVVSENDPLLAQHMRGSHHDAESSTTTSPRESTHYRASSTTGLLYDPTDPFGDGRSDASGSFRTHPAALAKAREARSRPSDPLAYPPSSYHGPRPDPEVFPMRPLGSGVLVHQDAGRVDASEIGETLPSYASRGR
ncbi:hypothetical protein FRC08_001251 [Ceratobasidium sp. 394]|nr:hypothetical protein FRC08_001251 [Ceratobasidium sp. 394]